MTDEELAAVLREAYDSAKPLPWIDGIDDHPATRTESRVMQRWLATVRETRHLIESSQREQTAAAILVQLLSIGRANAIVEAVTLTDALRLELKKPPR